MSAGLPAVPKTRRLLSARRLALLATVAALSGGVLLNGPIGPKSAFSPLVSQAYAESAARHVGFADIVEKVKPSVISVRVKVDAGAHPSGFNEDEQPFPKGSPFEFFFRRFGMPDDEFQRGGPHRHQFTMGQGSGFFISADGYAVTNNHVVDKAESVEVTTDDGKTYTAKVIGTDPRTDLALIKIDGRSDLRSTDDDTTDSPGCLLRASDNRRHAIWLESSATMRIGSFRGSIFFPLTGRPLACRTYLLCGPIGGGDRDLVFLLMAPKCRDQHHDGILHALR